MYKALAVLLTIFYLAGCTGAKPQQPYSMERGKVLISTSTGFEQEQRAQMFIIRIDDQPVLSDGLSRVMLEPGKHKLRVSFEQEGFSGETRLRCNLQADHIYEIYAVRQIGERFSVNIVDTTGSNKKIVNSKIAKAYLSPLNDPLFQGAITNAVLNVVGQ